MSDEALYPEIVGIALSVAIAVLVYSLVVVLLVDGNLENLEPEAVRIRNMDVLYGEPHDGDVFVIGASWVVEGVDAAIVEEGLCRRNVTGSVYNLGINNDFPLSRLAELDRIVAARPATVVIGLSYRVLTSRTTIDEARLETYYPGIPADERDRLRAGFAPAFDGAEERSVTPTAFEHHLEARKYLFSAAQLVASTTLGQGADEAARTRRYTANFRDPWIRGVNQSEDAKAAEAPTLEYEPVAPEETNLQLRAVRYTIERLEENGIRVIVVGMPQHPALSERIPAEDRRTLASFLESIDVPYYDLERAYPSEYFTDAAGHMNAAGRTAFSERVAGMVAGQG